MHVNTNKHTGRAFARRRAAKRLNVRGLKRRALSLVLLACVLTPGVAWSNEVAPRSQEFVITAYYSPKPGQCCYVRGSYEADIILNGRGTNGASGVEVHPGMAAAPKSYPFGTRVELPGIGIVTVQDRGGAIIEQGKVHRLDLWMGEGEEGLSRALAFGVQRVTGTVYLPGGTLPAESFSLARFDAPWTKLLTFLEGRETLLNAHPRRGEHGASVVLMQEALRAAGYFNQDPTGFFGPETEKSVWKFLADFNVDASPQTLTRDIAAVLLAAADRSVPDVLPHTVTIGSDPAEVRNVQRLLRYLGYYRGRTDGVYDADMRRAVLDFQLAEGVIASRSSGGAGTMGPRTRDAVARGVWKRRVASHAKDYVLLARIDDLLRERNAIPSTFLAKGETGEQVRLLQRLLVARGYLGADRATGYFGDETRKAVVAYQLAAGVINNAAESGAGNLGPGTRRALLTEMRSHFLSLVRASGWDVL